MGVIASVNVIRNMCVIRNKCDLLATAVLPKMVSAGGSSALIKCPDSLKSHLRLKNFTSLGENDDKDADKHLIHTQSCWFSSKSLKNGNQR